MSYDNNNNLEKRLHERKTGNIRYEEDEIYRKIRNIELQINEIILIINKIENFIQESEKIKLERTSYWNKVTIGILTTSIVTISGIVLVWILSKFSEQFLNP